MDMLVGLLLAAVVLLAVSLQRAYTQVPIKELKRRAKHDAMAAMLHQAAAYGLSLRAVLWVLVAASSAGFFSYAAGHMAGWLAFSLSALLVLAAFVWLPNRQAKQLSLWFATHLAPAFAWVLRYLHAPLTWVYEQLHHFSPLRNHTDVYDKEDLLQLINQQNDQPDNRIAEADLELAFNALSFSDKLISQHMTTRRAVKAVGIDDAIGPILMAELHDSGFSRFPVHEGKKDNIIGTLFLKDLVNVKASASVRSVMHPGVCYVHEDQTLADALQAILHTHHHMLVVVNEFEEYVGIITIDDVLEQIIGHAVVDDFDQYEDRRAVAQRAAKKEPQASEAETEVVE